MNAMEEYNLLVVSDLHLCEGVDPESGRYARQEDFLFDEAFARFLRYHERVKQQPRFGERPWLLVFNGDLCDFPQVDALPEDGEPLLRVKGVACQANLCADERIFGLGTSEQESVWKIERIARGHPAFFAALGWFVAHGNRIAVVKGNHDLEFHWPAVQRRFVAEVERAYTRQRQMLGEGPAITPEEIEERVRFYPWFYYEPGRVYAEHGGQYESSCHTCDYLNPVSCDDPDCLQVLWGNLFVRYLFNQIEDVHPFADNVKPATRYLVWALRKAPILTLRLIVSRGWIFLQAFWKVTRAALERRPSQEQAQPGPLPLEVTKEIAELAERQAKDSRREWMGGMLLIVLAVLVAALVIAAGVSFLVGLRLVGAICAGTAVVLFIVRLVARRRIPSFDDLMLRVARNLEQILEPPHAVRYILLGHDHVANMERMEDAWYVNTGAWVQVFEKKGPIEGREKLTFFRLAWGYEGVPQLLRWDDAVGEPALLRLGLAE
jgi:UDP-2,3-diacylglucosamine pyrophosphatase LpxH